MEKLIHTKSEIRNVLSVGLKEMRMFDGSEKTLIYLQQAGNKMYLAYIMMLENKIGKDIRTAKGVGVETHKLKNESMRKLYIQVSYLHSFFYQGFEGQDIKQDIRESFRKINNLVRN